MNQSRLRQLILVSAGQIFSYRPAVWLALLAVSTLINLGSIAPAIPALLATLISFITVFILPGFLLSSLIFDPEEISLAEQLPLAFVVGLGLLSLPAALLLTLEANLSMLAWVVVSLNFTLAGLYLWQRQKGQTAQGGAPEILNPILLAALLLAVAGVGYLFWVTASTWSYGDNWTYLLYIRHYLDRPLTDNITTVPGLEGASVRGAFNGWWVLQAFMDRVAGVEPVDLYSFYFPPLLMAISLLAFYSLARELCQSQNVALGATLLQILYCLSSIGSHEWIGRGFFDRIIEDKFLIWLIILPVATLIMLKYLSSGRKKLLLPLTLSLAALGLTHPIGIVQAGLSWAAFAGVHFLFNRQRTSVTRFVFIFLPLLLFLLVPLVQRQIMASQALEGAAFDYAGGVDLQLVLSRSRLWIFSALENSYMAHPHLIAHPLTLLAILLTPLLIQYLRQTIAAQFLFSNMVMTLFLLYNPLTAHLLGRLITPWMLWRISWLLPVALTVSFFLAKIEHWIQQTLPEMTSSTRRAYFQMLIPVLLIILVGLPLQGYIADGFRVLQERRVKTMTEAERELLVHLREQVPPGSMVVANSTFNTYIPAFTGSARVLTFRFLGQPSTVAAIDSLYRQRLITQSTLDLLEGWDTKYIIIERNQDLAVQFDLLSQMFVKRYQNAAYELYEIVPDHQPGYVVTGNTHLSYGKLEKAVAAYKQALALNPQDSLAHYGLGQVYQAQDKVTDAKAAYIQAVSTYPAYLPARLDLARLYVIEGHLDLAVDQYRTIIKLHPDYKPSFESLGDLYLAHGQEDEAFEQYQKVIEAPLETGEYYLKLADLCRTKGLATRAIDAYQNTLALKPHSRIAAAAYFGLASLYQAEGQLSEAIFVYQKGLSLAPDYRDKYIQLANLYLAEDYSDETEALYQNAARRNLNLAWPHLELGKFYLTQVNYR